MTISPKGGPQYSLRPPPPGWGGQARTLTPQRTEPARPCRMSGLETVGAQRRRGITPSHLSPLSALGAVGFAGEATALGPERPVVVPVSSPLGLARPGLSALAPEYRRRLAGVHGCASEIGRFVVFGEVKRGASASVITGLAARFARLSEVDAAGLAAGSELNARTVCRTNRLFHRVPLASHASNIGIASACVNGKATGTSSFSESRIQTRSLEPLHPCPTASRRSIPDSVPAKGRSGRGASRPRFVEVGHPVVAVPYGIGKPGANSGPRPIGQPSMEVRCAA